MKAPLLWMLCTVLGTLPAALQAQQGQVENTANAHPWPRMTTRLVQLEGFNSSPSVPAIWRVPTGRGPFPVAIILHGSGGMDSRGSIHALDLAKAGIASLELDMWGARKLAGGSQGRPKQVHDTLPDLYAALQWLAQQPNVDSQRLGVLGFSWGGVMALLSATAPFAPPPGLPSLQGHVAFYPVCWGYNRVPNYEFKTLAQHKPEVLILTGASDDYDDDAKACPNLREALPPEQRQQLEVITYPNAEHGFNGTESAIEYTDPFAHQGKGGAAKSAPNTKARQQARNETVAFFKRLFF